MIHGLIGPVDDLAQRRKPATQLLAVGGMDMDLDPGFRRQHDHAITPFRRDLIGSGLLVLGLDEGTDTKTGVGTGLEIGADSQLAGKKLGD
ncbi:MAG: hypothetical protein Q7U88_07495, partial [Desulfocapsaceae bacterium]|nr:hypothetical protein [Desulfocapsaceae bacterium]